MTHIILLWVICENFLSTFVPVFRQFHITDADILAKFAVDYLNLNFERSAMSFRSKAKKANPAVAICLELP